ncbi:glycosyltransferase [Bradyrhizobium diazoefficiens]|nr:glycosyltransferase [Bradyrhizobium diazoefficiens]MBR0779575.1 glycosyltransferase [Bradyrhizobium diazoefficiens]
MAAPIALFVFRRPDKTRATLGSLARCRGIEDTDLYIFCDGPRGTSDDRAVADVRAIVEAFDHPRKTLVISPENQGLARSIIAGVTRLCEQYGRVIVVEDDLIVSPAFLDYMNTGLDTFADDPRVMQISGFAFARNNASPNSAARFLPVTTSWGWATWSRSWHDFDPDCRDADALRSNYALRSRFDLGGLFGYYDMLQRQEAGRIDSWAIRWYWSVFRRDGLVLYPPVSLVRNDGLDSSGTHTSRSKLLWRELNHELPKSSPPMPDQVAIHQAALAELASIIDPLFHRRAKNLLRCLVFRVNLRMQTSMRAPG